MLFLDLLFPRRCPFCDEPLKPGKELVCPPCRTRISYLTEPTCLKCGKKVKDTVEFCEDCSGRSHHYDRGIALYEYQGLEGAIYRFKYKNRREYAEFFGKEISEKLGVEILRFKPDCLVPVPIHRKRLRSRGYNQAEELARIISGQLKIPYDSKLIKRVQATAPLKNLKLKERQNNLKKAFKINRNDVKLDRIIIIDDIYTTGSTIDAMAKEFRQIGVNKIYFVALSIGNYNVEV